MGFPQQLWSLVLIIIQDSIINIFNFLMGNLCEGPHNSATYTCVVKDDLQKELLFAYEKEDKVSDIKKKIEKKLGHNIADQQLSQNGFELNDESAMAHLDVEKHD